MKGADIVRWGTATMLFLIAFGLIFIATLDSQLATNHRIWALAGSLVSSLFGAGCLLHPDLAKKILVGHRVDK